MKKLFLLITALLPSLLFAQIVPDPFTLKGHITNAGAPAKAYLFYQLGANKIVDSAIIDNGKFEITGVVMNPVNAYLVIDHKGTGTSTLNGSSDILNLFLEKGTITVSGTDSVAKAQITGSVLNDENRKLNAQLKPVLEAATKLTAEVKAASPDQKNDIKFQNLITTRSKQIQQEQKSTLQTFAVTHPNSYLSLIIINMMGQQSTDPAELKNLFTALSPDLQNSEIGKNLKQTIDKALPTAIGSIAPDFTQNDVDGHPVTLSSFRGKYVLVDFWASWCAPCREESPNLVRAYSKYKNKNFTIISVSLDMPDGKINWLASIKHDGLVWTQVSDLRYWGNQAAVLYSISTIPSNFLLDPNGKIIARNLRGTDLEDKLAEVLAP
jgi:thiol-disulfide isomerase/thioredoxin